MTFQEHVPLAAYTTFRLGGPARFLVEVRTEDELRQTLHEQQKLDVPLAVLGGGSNVVFRDSGFDGLVLRPLFAGLSYEEDGEKVLATAGAGEAWDSFVADTVARGYWGLENLSGIPGSVGASPIQNIGAYGVEAGEHVARVAALDKETGEARVFDNTACRFGYRDSWFKTSEGRRFVITSVTYALSKTRRLRLSYKDLQHLDENTTHQEIRNKVLSVRNKKFPDLSHVGTAGSFFKNPIISQDTYRQLCIMFGDVPSYAQGDNIVKIPLAWLLERLGWKGETRGSVGSWHAQPIVLVHYGDGTATELCSFADEIAVDVFNKTNIVLEREVSIV